MPIDLGLARVARLLGHLNNPHLNAYKSIHVAGTNGKGSTVSYISSILTSANIRNGRFTSPHMLHYNDCVCINNEVYPLSKFNSVSQLVKEIDATHNVGCTEFELLTVTAFKVFELEKVQFAVIEVGMGGRLDATNVLQPRPGHESGVVATAITKIGVDHEGFLGDTIGKIALEKAGIIKRGVSCVVDRTNEGDALDVVTHIAGELGAPLYKVDGLGESEPASASPAFSYESLRTVLETTPLKGEYQRQNLSIALKVLEVLHQQEHIVVSPQDIARGIAVTTWQARLQTLEIPGMDLTVVLDGAHNESAAKELGKYVNTLRGAPDAGVIFIFAVTKGKAVHQLLHHVVKTTDKIICTSFSPPEGLPWVSCYPVNKLQQMCAGYDDVETREDVGQALEYAAKLRKEGNARPVVVFGSLYLGGDVLRLVESRSANK